MTLPLVTWILMALLTALMIPVAVAAALRWHARRSLLAQVRAAWGQPRQRDRKMEAIAANHRSRIESAPARGALDDRTWDDMNLDEVFARIDRTESTLGQQALYHRLRAAPVADNLDAFEALVTRMTADAPDRERAQIALAFLRDPHGYDLWWLGRPDGVEIRSWYVIFPILAGGMLSLLLLTSVWPGALPALIAAVAINVIVRRTTDRRIGALAAAFRQLAPLIATAQSLDFLNGREIDPIVAAIASEAPRLGRLKTIARWVSGDPFMLPLDTTLVVAATDVATVIYEYFNLFFLLDANAVYFGAAELRSRAPSLLRVIAAVGEVDAAISVASFRTDTAHWTRPQFLPAGSRAVLSDLRHPLIDEAVPNSITVGPPHGILVTGSNMSGKTTFLRTLGVSAVLAQTINTCLATEYAAPVFHVRSCIGRADDLLHGKSYYIVEVEAVLALLRASRSPEPHLFLFDELFRGTNAVERIAAAEAVLDELLRRKRHVVVAATHDGELVALLRESYVPYHFTDTLGIDGLVFEYRLQEGPASTRNAIALLKLYGAPDDLVSRALDRAARLDRQRELTQLPSG